MKTGIPACLSAVLLSVSVLAAPDDGLMGYWDFGEGMGKVLHDKSGHENHGEIKGAVWVKSGKGYALKFDGTDDYVDCGKGPSLDITGPITLQAWVMPTAANRGEPGIVGKFFESYALTYYGSIYFYISSGGNNVSGPSKINEWLHVTATFDGTTMRMFLNGMETASAKSKFDKIKHGNNFLMGCVVGDPMSDDPNLRRTSFFPGLIDAVRVHNRVLSQREILQYYNLDAADKGQKPFDMSKMDRFQLDPFFYPDKDKAVLAVDFRWIVPLPQGSEPWAELARAGDAKALQRKRLNPNLPRFEDEAEFQLNGLKPGTYELRVLLRSMGKVIEAEHFARKSPRVKAYTSGWLAGRMNLFGGWAEYDIVTAAGDYRLSVLAARIYDSAGIRCTIDGKSPAEINLNGPHTGGRAAWEDAKWETFGSYTLSKGRHTLRVEIVPVHVKEKDTTYARDVYVDAFSLAAVASEAQAAQRMERVSFSYPFKPLPPLDSPAKRVVAPLPPVVTPPPYDVRMTEGGGLEVAVKGHTYKIESSYSYPHGGYNRLLAGALDRQGQKSWRVERHKEGRNGLLMAASGAHYAISRRVTREKSRIVVKDTIRNKTDDVIGIIISNHINVRNMKDIKVARMTNPTIFASEGDTGVGLIALDDLYQLQQKNAYADGIAEITTEHFGLDKGASYTVEWAIYPTATTDYYDFINQVRWDEGLNRRVEGAFGFVSRRKPPTLEEVENKNLSYSSIGCLGKPLDNPATPLEGIEFVEYPKESAALRKTFAETKAMYPGMKVMFHVAHSLYMCNNPDERFADSRAIDAGGRQIHYGPNSMDYYGRYISKKMFDDNWRWWTFYPTMENSFGKAMIKAMEYMVNDMGATGMWADGYMSGYARGYSYDRWDGHSVTIDPETKLVTRKKTCVSWVALPVLKKVARIISDKGGVLVSNGHPGPRSYWKEDVITSCETGGGDARPIGGLHLGRTVTPLGNPKVIKNMRDFYRDMLRKLDFGALFFWYGGGGFNLRKTLTEHMYPITFESIHAGTVRGKERVITKESAIYGWHGDRALHAVYLYDARGEVTRGDFMSTVDKSGVRTEVKLQEDQAAAVVKLPITLAVTNPVNVSVRQYDLQAIRLALNGRGTAEIHVAQGEFPLYRNLIYQVTVGDKTRTIAEYKTELAFSVHLDGETGVTIRRVGKP